mgnify:CR=1 FL=1
MKVRFLPFILCLAVIACSKDKNNDNDNSKTTFLTSGTWQYEDGGVDVDKNNVIDMPFSGLGVVPDCLFDNTAHFHADGTGIAEEGPVKCDPSGPSSSNFSWSFQNNAAQITISGPGLFGIGGTFNVLELNANRFTVAKDTSISIGGGLSLDGRMIVMLKH